MEHTVHEIQEKNSALTVQDLKRLLFRCAATLIFLPQVRKVLVLTMLSIYIDLKCDYELLHHLVTLPFEVFTSSAIYAGIEVWTWVIAEKPDMEVALMGEIFSAWSDTVRQNKGIFSTAMKCVIRHCLSYIYVANESPVTPIRSTILSRIVPQTKRLSLVAEPTLSAFSHRMDLFYKCFSVDCRPAGIVDLASCFWFNAWCCVRPGLTSL